MKRIVLTVMCLGFGATMLWGCPKQQDSPSSQPSDAAGTSDKPPFQLYTTGVPKYDSYFQRVYRLRYKLWKADRDLATTPATLHGVMGLPGNVKGSSLTDLLGVAVQKFGSKLSFAGGRVGVREGVNDTKAGQVAQTIDNALTTSKEMPKNLGGAVTESKDLIVEGKNLTTSVPNDFTGFNALKAPQVTAKLGESMKELAKVPEQVAQLGKTSVGVAKAIPAAFTGK